MLSAPIAGLIDILKFMRNDSLTASPAQRKTLLDVAHRLELVCDRFFEKNQHMRIFHAF